MFCKTTPQKDEHVKLPVDCVRGAKQQDEMLWREADVSTSGEFGIARAMFWLVDTIIANFSGISEYEDLIRLRTNKQRK